MTISDDWDFDYPNQVIQHVDGILNYDGGTAGQAAVGQYIRGDTSGAIGKVIALTGSAATGSYTLTNTVGLFIDNEPISLMSEQNFDGVVDKAVALQGISVGDPIVDQVTGTITVRAVEYNVDGVGGGTMYGDTMVAFTNDSSLDVTGGEAGVALADGTGTDNDAVIDTAIVNLELAVPGTASENDSVLIHYDAGAIAIPEQAIVEDASTGAIGLVEQVTGVLATGSVRIVNYDSTGGVWTNNNSLQADQALIYQNQVAGQVFSVGDVVLGVTSGATGRVILDDTGSTTLIFADESGTWTTTEDLNVGGVKIAEANGTNTILALATINLPDGIRTEQRPAATSGGVAQGGIYDAGDSLNIVRKLNSLYTLSQDTFDELLQMDDDEAMDAAGKGIAYSLVFGWRIEQGGERFLRQGGLVDTTGAEVWANPQTVGAQNKITSTGFLIDTTQTFRQPQLYIEQDGAKLAPWWLEGNIDVLVRVKTRQDTRYIDPATPGLGQLIPGGDPAQGGFYAVFNREYYTSTYDATEVNASGGGVNTVALGTADDTAADRNPEGTHTMNWDAGDAFTLVVGEEFEILAPTDSNSQKVGIVVAQTGGTGATGTLEYVLKGGTQFGDGETLVSRVSGKGFDVDTAPTTVVAGYSADIRHNVVDIIATPSGGTGITGTFTPGEGVTQASTGATGFFVAVDNSGTNTIAIEVTVGGTAFSGDNDITGDSSSAAWDAGTGATYPSAVTFTEDLNNGDGDQPYSGSVSGDITGASAETIQNVYQYSKYITRQEEETLIVDGPGTTDVGTVGNLFRRLKDAYAEVKPGPPIGTFTGSMALAQGWFLDTGFLDAADIRSFSVIDDNGVLRNPPNLQSLTISGVAVGWRAAAYRSTGAGLTLILRTEFQVGAIGSGNNEAADSTVLFAAQDRAVSPLPADVPDSGVLRILSPSDSNNSGNYIRMDYSSVNRTTNIFTLTGTIGSFLTAAGETSNPLALADNAHVVFIEEQSAGASVTNTMQYVADIPIVFKARLKGFKPFRSTTTFASTGGAGGVVQNADPIVDLP